MKKLTALLLAVLLVFGLAACAGSPAESNTKPGDTMTLQDILTSITKDVADLLASHFGRTYSVDLRYYRNYLGSDFSLSDYLRRNSITKVLLIGNVDYYISPDFALEN